MGRNQQAPDRVARLEALKALLADRDVTTAGELADELGVSVRTLHRDLATLRELGTPIDGDRGRGGGLRLERGWSLGRVHLNESEAMGLLLSLTIAEKIGSPLLLDDLRSVTRKVSSAFAPAQARRVTGLRRRILVGQPASEQMLASYRPPQPHIVRPLLDAFTQQRLIGITYADQHNRTTERDIEVQYLYYNLPVWYVLAWDRLRDDVRFFRIDRVDHVHHRPGKFRLRHPDAFLAAGESDTRTV
jgi:predicted DNA-binding transcriptional regulator YafY